VSFLTTVFVFAIIIIIHTLDLIWHLLNYYTHSFYFWTKLSLSGDSLWTILDVTYIHDNVASVSFHLRCLSSILLDARWSVEGQTLTILARHMNPWVPVCCPVGCRVAVWPSGAKESVCLSSKSGTTSDLLIGPLPTINTGITTSQCRNFGKTPCIFRYLTQNGFLCFDQMSGKRFWIWSWRFFS
jgi:hypothetical protein